MNAFSYTPFKVYCRRKTSPNKVSSACCGEWGEAISSDAIQTASCQRSNSTGTFPQHHHLAVSKKIKTSYCLVVTSKSFTSKDKMEQLGAMGLHAKVTKAAEWTERLKRREIKANVEATPKCRSSIISICTAQVTAMNRYWFLERGEMIKL